jgi:regulatory protein
MGLERLAPLGDEGGEPARRTPQAPRAARPEPPAAEGRPPPFGVSAQAFLAARGVVPEPLVDPAPPRPRRSRPVAPDLPAAVDLTAFDEGGAPAEPGRFQGPAAGRRVGGGKGGRGQGPKTWPTREERDARREDRARAQAEQIAADPVGVAREICLRQLEVGPRTRQELALALARKGVPDEAAAQVLGRFAEVGIIDDALFASMWVSSRHRGRGLAGRALSQELRRKGVDDELVREAVGALDPAVEAETARSLVRRKLASTRGLATDARVRRLAGMLARKGYGAGLAFRIVREELEREGTDPPELSFDALQALDD